MEEMTELVEYRQDVLPEPELPPQDGRFRGFSARLRLGLALILCVAAVLCKSASPESADQVQRWIVGDGSERVQQALFRMEEALEQGQGMSDAWTVFCQELTDETA